MTVRRPVGPRRPSKPRSTANPSRVQMSRSHAQELAHAASEPSFQTKVKRQAYWARRLASLERYDEEVFSQEMAALGHEDLRDETKFATANIHSATLQPTDPNVQRGEIEIPGLDTATGAIPPPPR